MESDNQNSDIDSDCEQNIPSFTKLSLHSEISTDKENEGTKLAKLFKRYTENKEKQIRNIKDLHKVSSILRRYKRQTICFEEYSKLDEQQIICKGSDKVNKIDIHLPQGMNTMKKLSKYSVENLKNLRIFIESHFENEHENIEEFLLSFSSTQIEGIIFRGHSIIIHNENYDTKEEYFDYYEVFPCSSYFYGLRDAMSKATKFIYINTILLSSKEFSAILRASKHVKELRFFDCKILTDEEYELSEMEGCRIDFLQVYYYIDCSNAYLNPHLLIYAKSNYHRKLKKKLFDLDNTFASNFHLSFIFKILLDTLNSLTSTMQ